MIDTHAHLDLLDDPAGAVERAAAAGVTAILTVGTNPASWETALALARAHAPVYAILGLHPHDATGDPGELAPLLDDPNVVALGETGLDFYRDYAPRDAQRRVFAAQLELAAATGKTVVVHTRAADDEVAEVLAGFTGTVVLHCFSSPRLLPVALERGYYVSFAGNLTYPSASELRLAATQVPAERLLAETDAPYLAPQPQRGRRNEPAYVVHTLAALASARGEQEEELERTIEANARAAFGLP